MLQDFKKYTNKETVKDLHSADFKYNFFFKQNDHDQRSQTYT